MKIAAFGSVLALTMSAINSGGTGQAAAAPAPMTPTAAKAVPGDLVCRARYGVDNALVGMLIVERGEGRLYVSSRPGVKPVSEFTSNDLKFLMDGPVSDPGKPFRLETHDGNPYPIVYAFTPQAGGFSVLMNGRDFKNWRATFVCDR